MAQMKYIRFLDAGFVVFQEHITHAKMKQKFPNDEVLSAGFVSLKCEAGYDYLGCSGESVSLKTSSKDRDSEDLERNMSIFC